MSIDQDITTLLQHHKCVANFDYKLAVDWAIKLIEQGQFDNNTLMLASFSEPIDSYEIRPYVSAALASQGLDEIIDDDAFLVQARFYIVEIINGYSIRKNLRLIRDLSISKDYREELGVFYLLYYAWEDLDDIGYTFYYDDVSLDTIEAVLQEQASFWIDTYSNPAQ